MCHEIGSSVSVEVALLPLSLTVRKKGEGLRACVACPVMCLRLALPSCLLVSLPHLQGEQAAASGQPGP